MTGRAKLETGRPALRLERRLSHSPEKVWRAITDPAELAHWFPATVEAELRTGGTIRFTFPGQDETTTGQVLAADPPREFTFTWNEDTLRWLITPDGDGCRLEFTHTFGRGEPAIAKLAAGRTAAGWDVCLETLEARLAGLPAPAQPSDWHDRMSSYVEEFGLGDGEVLGDGAIRFRRDLVWKPPAEVWPLLSPESGEITVSEEPHVLESVGDHGKVRWELTRDPLDGVRVEYTQTADGDVPALLAAAHERLDALFAATHGVEQEPWSADRVEAIEKHYAERQTQDS